MRAGTVVPLAGVVQEALHSTVLHVYVLYQWHMHDLCVVTGCLACGQCRLACIRTKRLMPYSLGRWVH